MESSKGRSRFHRAKGLRVGVVIGVALALVGAAVGTATGAVTPFQKVVIVNAPASPIPVMGTVSISNTPANQNVTVTNTSSAAVPVEVTNLPATQPVSGTVNIGNLSAVQLATKAFSEQRLDIAASDDTTFDFGRTINVSTLIMDNRGDDDTMLLSLETAAGVHVLIREGDGSFIQNFTMPVPATSVSVTCFNLVTDCEVWLTALGS